MTPHELAAGTKLLPCRCCGSEAEIDKFQPDTYAYTCKIFDDCGVIGPNKPSREEAATAWNALMAPASQPAEPPEGTVRVKIPAHKTEAFDLAFGIVCGIFNDGNIKDFTSGEPIIYITADLPLPKPVEVQGVVE